MKDLYPFGSLLRCPYCGHSLNQRFVFDGIHFLCEGDSACRRFVIPAEPIRDAMLKAWKEVSPKELRRLLNELQEETANTASSTRSGVRRGARSRADAMTANEIRLLIEEKKKNPVFDEVNYWWLDEYVLRITFGRHESMGQSQNPQNRRKQTYQDTISTQKSIMTARMETILNVALMIES